MFPSYSSLPSSSGNRKSGLSRSNSSFLGTIKNIVTAPLSWFAPQEDFEGTPTGKRRLLKQNGKTQDDDGNRDRDGESRNKRMRINSPDREPAGPDHGYLDPPPTVFQPRPLEQSRKIQKSISDARLLSKPRNSTSRRTHSPLPSTSRSQPSALSRTMSMDPPSFSRSEQRDEPLLPRLSRDSRSMSISRDVSPASGPFRLRTSITPQPSSFQRRDREPSDPPPLLSLMSNPTFVRPPDVSHLGRSLSVQPTPTLGSLVESQRNTRSPVRQRSSLFGVPSASATDLGSLQVINPAERALSQLDVYRTPLLPSRLRGSSVIPDMFTQSALPRKSSLTLLLSDRDKPRLGKKSKTKGKRKEGGELNESKPYAGKGGMKKLLAKRRLEQEDNDGEVKDAEEKEKDIVMDNEINREVVQPELPAAEPEREQIAPKAVPERPAWFDQQPASTSSSLRVGRTRISRSHAQAVPRSKNSMKFSAVYEDEDEDMDDGEGKRENAGSEGASRKPVFEIPVGFAFPKEVPPALTDLDTAKEPPIVSLPFSLTKPAPSSPAPPSAKSISKASDFTPIPTPPVTAFGQPASRRSGAPSPSPTPSAAAPPSITLVPPTPVPQKTSSGIPNFFASSSILAQPIVPPPVIATTSSASTPATSAPVTDAENPLWEGEKSENTAPVISNHSTSAVSSAGSSSLFGGATASAFGGASSDTAFGKPPASAVKRVESSVLSAVSVGEEPKADAAVAATPSTFGIFSLPKATANEDSPKQSAPFAGFGASIITSAGKGPAETSKSSSPLAFSFGKPPGSTPTVPAVEAPNSAFGSSSGGFAFGQPYAPIPASNANKDMATVVSTPSLFNAPPSSPPTSKSKKPGTLDFGTSPPTLVPPNAGFSFAGSSSTDVSSKPLAFSAPVTVPARPATPPKSEQEVKMDESPTRDMQLNGNSVHKEVPKLTTTFSFGGGTGSGGSASGSTNAFGRSTSQSDNAGFTFGAPPTASASGPFGAPKIDTKAMGNTPFGGFGQPSSTPSAPSPFSFGQPPAAAGEQPRPTTSGPFSFSKAAESESSRSSSSGPFTFGQSAPTAATTNVPPFSFGATGATATNSNVFSSQSSNAVSAPNSPSNFPQPTPFSFSPTPTPTTAPLNPFTFGASQPASPAGVNSNLPQAVPHTPSGGGSFSFGAAQPASPFAANTGAAPSAVPTGGALFTIGAAPAPSGQRQIRKLPNRRGGKR